jgi:phage repressor protein C with HTH and peptisase S24 domain
LKINCLRNKPGPHIGHTVVAVDPSPHVLLLASESRVSSLANVIQALGKSRLAASKSDRLQKSLEANVLNRRSGIHVGDSTPVEEIESTAVVVGVQQTLYVRRNMALGARLDQAMTARGITQAELARLSGVDEATISATVLRDSATSKYGIQYAMALRISLRWLLSGDGSMEDEQELMVAEARKHYYPRAYENVTARAGTGRFNEEPAVELEGIIPIPMERISERGWKKERLRVIKSEGMSNFPTLADGEPLVINLDETKILNGNLYAIEDADEGLRVKRLSQTSDGRVAVRSDNADKFTYPDEFLGPDSGARVVGRVYRLGELLIPMTGRRRA